LPAPIPKARKEHTNTFQILFILFAPASPSMALRG
jgi:hypothetical protein